MVLGSWKGVCGFLLPWEHVLFPCLLLGTWGEITALAAELCLCTCSSLHTALGLAVAEGETGVTGPKRSSGLGFSPEPGPCGWQHPWELTGDAPAAQPLAAASSEVRH